MAITKKRALGSLGLVLLLAAFLVAGCNSNKANKAPAAGETPTATEVNYKDISAEELKTMMETNKDLLVVDVREKEEYDQGHIDGTLLIPTTEFQERFTELPMDKPIVLVCRSGRRSAEAAGFLVQQGYTEVYNLSGGVKGWTYGLKK